MSAHVLLNLLNELGKRDIFCMLTMLLSLLMLYQGIIGYFKYI